ncbi:MAG: thiamine-phosphate kinase, partial [Blastocatellia bacterium]|nr:thiamine-phosphate kinase [Blastocatellia bacterium]
MKSEFEFIAELKARTLTGTFPDLITGIGDDAAVVASSVDREWLITSDLLVEDTHFSLDFTSADRLGYKALAVNLSDIAAMGGQPKFFLLNIATPKKYTGQFLRDFSDGILTFAKQQNVQLIGGDTSSSKDKLFISITLIGECKRGKAVRRNSAQAGDLVYITGSLGGSALGLQLLKSGLRLAESGTLLPLANDLFASFNSRDTRNKLAAIKAHLLPIPRVELGRVIGERGLASAMIDISDGLSSDLIHICHDSNVGVEVFVDKLPIAP